MNEIRSPFGFGVHKLHPSGASREERRERSRQMLARVLNLHTAIAFVGSGCSVPLNYPSWQKLALMVVAETLRNTRSATEEQKKRLKRFQRQLKSKRKVASEQLLFMLGVCQQLFQETDPKEGKSAFRRFVAGKFEPTNPSRTKNNPYHALMELPIQRFVTSNYDLEIERALASERKVDPTHLRLNESGIECPPENLRSFTQQPEHFDHLALFVLSRVDNAKNMVFHCHGSYLDPESLVITEADYQSWYFSGHDHAAAGFRQNLHLLLGSNPILFVGFGLNDDDLIRPLRMFAAEDLQAKSSRPLFALMPQRVGASRDELDRTDDYFDQLYDRYGVHVIPFKLDKKSNSKKTLFHELKRLNNDRLDIRDSWLQKPCIRKVDVSLHPPARYRHYPLERRELPKFRGTRDKLLDKLCGQAADPDVRVIGLIGPGGTGKSWLAQELLERISKEVPGIQGRFFWSSFYSNDALTGMDRALAYLENGAPGEGDRIGRFVKCLAAGKHLLVFDGIERFLHETDNPLLGQGYSPLTEKLFEVMASKGQSTIIITSRLWPEKFGETMDDENGPARCHLIPRFRSEDIREVEPFSWITDQDAVPELVSLLDGHVHALVLAAETLRQGGKDDALQNLREMKRKLSGTPPDRRGDRMIRLVIESLDKDTGGLATKLLERLAVFMTPVKKETVSICFAQACKEADNECSDQQTVVDKLVDSRLLHRIVPRAGKSKYSYTVHPIVREYIFHRIHKAPAGSLPNFTLPGFTAVTSAFHPGSKETVEMLKKLLNELCETAEQKLNKGNRREATALCRSAFSVVRSRMEALTAPRWCSYDEYLRILIKVSHLAKKIAGYVWSFAERRSISSVESEDGPLYADELAWLYNELGLACYAEGAMPDTLAIWEQGLEINRAIDSQEEGGSYLFQSLCNLGAAQIYYGRLEDAENYLREAERTNFRLNDEDHRGRITGYLALVKHLRGNLPQADALYGLALRQLDKRKKFNARAKSNFSRHRADLKIKLQDFDEARACIEMSRGLAEEGNFPELAAAARMSWGHWFRSQGRYNEATREYNFALREAKRIGMRRLECEVLSEFARLALDLGDSLIAQQRAVESLRIANELVLGLKQTHDLVVLGRATIEARQHKLGIAYLKHAKRLADQQGYWLRSHEAEEQLHRFGESASDVES